MGSSGVIYSSVFLRINDSVVPIRSERSFYLRVPKPWHFHYIRSFPLIQSDVKQKKEKKKNSKGNCHIPPVNIVTIVFIFFLLADSRRQSSTVQSYVSCDLEVGHWFTTFLPTTRTRKKKIQIKSQTQICFLFFDMLFDSCSVRELAQKWLRPSVECLGVSP